MNDRYLYRAKRTDNGEWVEGALFDGEKHCIIGHTIKFSPYVQNECKILGHEVERNTICQFTTFSDEDGMEICEGDIVGFIDCTSTENGYSEHYCIGRVLWDEETGSFQVTERLSAESNEVLDRGCKVIGNIFDNPELLEVEEW